jgi:hypothetical protein
MPRKSISPYALLLLLHFLLFSHPVRISGQAGNDTKIDSLARLLDTTENLDEKKRILTALCIQYRLDGNWDKHSQIIEEMFRLQEEEPDSAFLADTYNQLGIANSLKGDNAQSLEDFQMALSINRDRGHMFGVSASYENLALVYTHMGDYRNAVECLLKSVEIKKEHNYSRIFNIYIKLASLQQLLETDKVDYYISLAQKELQKMDSIRPADKVVFYNELSLIYKNREMYDSSILYSRDVVRISKEIDWNAGIAAGFSSLAEVFYRKGDLDSSIVYHRNSLRLSQELSDCTGIVEENLYLAKLYLENKQLDSVLVLANESLLKAEECDLLNAQGEALKFIADFYQEQDEFEQAFLYLQKYYTIQDSIASSEVKNNIAELEARYQSELQEQQIGLLTAENKIKSQRLQVSILVVVILTILILLILYAFIMRRREAVIKENNLKQQLFQAQMNPHFIFNALTSIQNYMYRNDPDATAGYLARFSFLMRSILSNSSKDSISLAEEIEILKSYIELEKMRLNHSFEYEILYSEELETELIHIPPMLIQPFIENAIRHGLGEIKNNGMLSVSFEDRGEFLQIQIVDNGIGINESRKSNRAGHKSMALSIFTQRMQLIRKRSRKIPPPRIEDRSESGSEGTFVELYLPILG